MADIKWKIKLVQAMQCYTSHSVRTKFVESCPSNKIMIDRAKQGSGLTTNVWHFVCQYTTTLRQNALTDHSETWFLKVDLHWPNYLSTLVVARLVYSLPCLPSLNRVKKKLSLPSPCVFLVLNNENTQQTHWWSTVTGVWKVNMPPGKPDEDCPGCPPKKPTCAGFGWKRIYRRVGALANLLVETRPPLR